jgi:hypothetical protein
MKTKGIPFFIVFFGFLFLHGIAQASDFLFYKELNLIGGYSNKKQWVGSSDTLSNSVGFEHYGKFSSEYGDYLTTDLQIRGAYDANQRFSDAVSLEIHNAWAEYRANNELKIKGGHFAPAFGLEPIVDYHSTILHSLIERDIGFEKDWGVELRGSLPAFDYQTAFQIGSGMSIRREDSSFLVTGRVGTSPIEDFQYGISAMVGNVLETIGMSTFPHNHLLSKEGVFKQRVGLDCQYNWNSFLFKTETAYGTNETKNVIGYMTEVDYTAPKNQNWGVETQFQSWFNDMKRPQSDDTTFSLCLSYKLSDKITLRVAFIHDLNLSGDMFPEGRDTRVLAQFYYYGK